MRSAVRAASGGVVVVAALIALMFFRGPGTGSNESDGDGFSPVSPSMATTQAPVESPTAITADTAEGGLTPDEQKALDGRVLGVLIDEWDYLLEVPGEVESIYRPAGLDRLIVLAQQVDGDSNGIRVRILQRESARPKAEQDLRNALSEVGLGPEAIYMPDSFIP